MEMELNADLVGIQGILTSVSSKTDSLNKIKYVGGNENKIKLASEELKKFLVWKGYINTNDELNRHHLKELTDITTFLALNSEFNDTNALNIKEYEHLVNIAPTLSKCLLANLIVNLDLTKCYGESIQILPLHLTSELLDEMIPCLKRKSPDVVLSHSYIVIKCIIQKLKNNLASSNVNDAADKLSDISIELLKPIAGVNPENIQSWKQKKLYTHIGYSLYKMLKLLLLCDTENELLIRIVDCVIRNVISIVQAVTLDVFCSWAEMKHKGRVFQMVIGEKAYHVIETQTKYKKAKELVQMLSTIATKPKTLKEKILDASDEEMVANVNAGGPEQKQWFNALLNTQIFHKEEIMNCIDQHYNLCNLDDVSRVLKLSLNYELPEVKRLAIKCTSNLSVKELTLAMTRFFRYNGLKNHLEHEDITQVLTNCLNKIHNSKEYSLSLHEVENFEIKEIQLIFLQNPKQFVKTMYDECIKNTIYTYWLKHAFIILRDVIDIDSLGMKALEGCFETHKLTEDNLMGFVHLLQMLISTKCIDKQNMFNNILQTHLESSFTENKELNLRCLLLMIKELKTDDLDDVIKNDLATFCISILQKYRSKYNEFTYMKLNICIAAVSVLNSTNYLLQEFKTELDNQPWNKYYIASKNDQFLSFVSPDFSLDNYGDAVEKLLKILSRCVPTEWEMVVSELNYKFGSGRTLEVLTDCLILICQVTATQNSDANPTVYHALTYYLQYYGISIKILKEKQNNQEFEVLLVRSICKMLRYIPGMIRNNEGMKLVTLFSCSALKTLAKDQEFVGSLVAIDDGNLKKIIAQKVLAADN